MRKFILFFVLLVLFLAFIMFLVNAFLMQKNYFENTDQKDQENVEDITQEIIETPSIYIDYTKEDYDKALLDKRGVVLYFTSNWCQECLDQEVVNENIFEELSKEGIVGLKIHILDSETTTETDALSQKFDVSKEQSFVLLDKNGVVFFKHTGFLSKDQLKQKIMEVVNK